MIVARPSTRSTTVPSSASMIRSSGMPVDRAIAACARRWRHSPCTGMWLRRTDRVEQVAQLAGRRVPGDVHERRRLVHHGGAEPGQPVDHLADRRLVAGDQRGRQQDRVVGGDPDRLVLAVGHPRQRRQRLALRAGRDQQHPPRRQFLGHLAGRSAGRPAPAAGRVRGRSACCAPSSGRPARPAARPRRRRRAPAARGARARRSRRR